MITTLSFKYQKKDYTSKPFDFEAFCLINEKHANPEIKGVATSAKEAVEYMFNGTEGAKYLKELPVSEMFKLCDTAWGIYSNTLLEAAKND